MADAPESPLPRPDFATPRLFVDAPLAAGGRIRLGREQAHYALHVLRLGQGDPLLLFNGRDGEWRGIIEPASRRDAEVALAARTREQPPASRIGLAFAPLKHARLDYMAQKAVEMGAGALQPILTRRTQATRVNIERMRANAIEAAEQCGVLAPAAVREPIALDALLARWSPADLAVFCDEAAEVADPVAALKSAGKTDGAIHVFIGPEGGFDPVERAALAALPRRVVLSLGPRILRADTAAVAALALVQAVLGDGAATAGL